MHFHHKHDVAGCTDEHHDWPDYITALLATIDRRDLQLMTAIQDQIDSLAAQLTAAIGEVASELDGLRSRTADPDADFSELQAAVAAVNALVGAPAPQPAPAPVVEPSPVEPATEPIPAAVVDSPAQPNAAQVPSA